MNIKLAMQLVRAVAKSRLF